MEALVVDDSPLAAYLEGDGEADTPEDDNQDTHNARFSDSSSSATKHASFAPRGFPSYLEQITIPARSLRRIHGGPLSRVRNIYAFLVTSTLGRADNERFLEHFRYIIIASQLLNDHSGHGLSKPNPETDTYPSPLELPRIGTSLTGAAISASAAFLLVYVLHWSRDATSGAFLVQRLLIALLLTALAAVILYAFVRRQWLKYLRRRAIDAATTFISSVQSFESITSPLLTFIQEVELVSRGYQISHPLPPVSRLEGPVQTRKCSRLRSHLNSVYSSAIPAFTVAIETLRPHLNDMDLDRFMEVYDIHETDTLEASLGTADTDDDQDPTSLKRLRLLDHRLSLLRRIFLCSLLSIPATGRKIDAVRWRTAIAQMEGLLDLLDELSEQTTKVSNSEAETTSTQPPRHSRLSLNTNLNTHTSPTSPNFQIRRMSALTTGIRSLQAKLYLLNEESTRSVSTSTTEPDLARLATSLREQYDSIGNDLRALMQAWESSRASLLEDISKQERRMSLASSSHISAPSLGGLTAVEEDSDSADDPTSTRRQASKSNRSSIAMLSPRSAALRRLTGDTSAIPAAPASPPITESGESEADAASGGSSGRDEEVFEAVAAPLPVRARSELSREQRIAKMHEERERQRLLREKSELSTNMIRELRSVIRLRPAPAGKRDGTAAAAAAGGDTLTDGEEPRMAEVSKDLNVDVPASPTRASGGEGDKENVMPVS